MKLDFNKFKEDLSKHLNEMLINNQHLFVTNVDKDVLWNMYLDTIPTEANKIIKVRREFDCSNCRHFIKVMGNVIAIHDGSVETIWDFEPQEDGWKDVVKALSDYVKSNPIYDIFFIKRGQNWTEFQYGSTRRWNTYQMAASLY